MHLNSLRRSFTYTRAILRERAGKIGGEEKES